MPTEHHVNAQSAVPFAFYSGDGNDGTRCINHVWVPNQLVDDHLPEVCRALDANRYVTKASARRHLMRAAPIIDEDEWDGQITVTLMWDTGPKGEMAFGSSWKISELRQIKADALVEFMPHEIEHIYTVLDNAARAWLRKNTPLVLGCARTRRLPDPCWVRLNPQV